MQCCRPSPQLSSPAACNRPAQHPSTPAACSPTHLEELKDLGAQLLVVACQEVKHLVLRQARQGVERPGWEKCGAGLQARHAGSTCTDDCCRKHVSCIPCSSSTTNSACMQYGQGGNRGNADEDAAAGLGRQRRTGGPMVVAAALVAWRSSSVPSSSCARSPPRCCCSTASRREAIPRGVSERGQGLTREPLCALLRVDKHLQSVRWLPDRGLGRPRQPPRGPTCK